MGIIKKLFGGNQKNDPEKTEIRKVNTIYNELLQSKILGGNFGKKLPPTLYKMRFTFTVMLNPN